VKKRAQINSIINFSENLDIVFQKYKKIYKEEIDRDFSELYFSFDSDPDITLEDSFNFEKISGNINGTYFDKKNKSEISSNINNGNNEKNIISSNKYFIKKETIINPKKTLNYSKERNSLSNNEFDLKDLFNQNKNEKFEFNDNNLSDDLAFNKENCLLDKIFNEDVDFKKIHINNRDENIYPSTDLKIEERSGTNKNSNVKYQYEFRNKINMKSKINLKNMKSFGFKKFLKKKIIKNYENQSCSNKKKFNYLKKDFINKNIYYDKERGAIVIKKSLVNNVKPKKRKPSLNKLTHPYERMQRQRSRQSEIILNSNNELQTDEILNSSIKVELNKKHSKENLINNCLYNYNNSSSIYKNINSNFSEIERNMYSNNSNSNLSNFFNFPITKKECTDLLEQIRLIDFNMNNMNIILKKSEKFSDEWDFAYIETKKRVRYREILESKDFPWGLVRIKNFSTKKIKDLYKEIINNPLCYNSLILKKSSNKTFVNKQLLLKKRERSKEINNSYRKSINTLINDSVIDVDFKNKENTNNQPNLESNNILLINKNKRKVFSNNFLECKIN